MANSIRTLITLVCSGCARMNYTTSKNARTITDKLTFKKFCKFCKKQLDHKEGKVPKAS